ncbi:DUF488 domain-containing protein [Parapedobacter sp. GCM10030251]|uniref:DUF488 domain-containing protein n=1 Tax=Parapedobacter sp. GCM10030251 TaxID=3273419 RepID=UPI0036138A6E
MDREKLSVKRVYEPYDSTDGFRILVDRLWPRGLKRDDARLDEWMKEVAPSTELRTWFGHDPEKWEAFRQRYRQELEENEAVDHLVTILKEKDHVTLLYAAKDPVHNQAIVLKDFIIESDS